MLWMLTTMWKSMKSMKSSMLLLLNIISDEPLTNITELTEVTDSQPKDFSGCQDDLDGRPDGLHSPSKMSGET